MVHPNEDPTTPLPRDVGVSEMETGLILIDKDTDFEFPLESVAVKLPVKLPEVVGVPEIVRVAPEGLAESPGGRPEELQLYEPIPPLAVRDVE